MKSAIEQSIEALLMNVRDGVRTHDRGVVFGLLLTCIPFLPVTCFGLFITCWNYILYKYGRLDITERRLISAAFYIGTFNIILGVMLLVLLTTVASSFVPAFIYNLGQSLRSAAGFIGDLLLGFKHGTHGGNNI